MAGIKSVSGTYADLRPNSAVVEGSLQEVSHACTLALLVHQNRGGQPRAHERERTHRDARQAVANSSPTPSSKNGTDSVKVSKQNRTGERLCAEISGRFLVSNCGIICSIYEMSY